ELEVTDGVPSDFPVLGGVVGQDPPVRGHRLDERGMGTADLGGLDVEESVALKRAVIGAVERTGEEDLARCVTLELRAEGLVVARLAEHHQTGAECWVLRAEFLVRLDYFEGVVLGLEAA